MPFASLPFRLWRASNRGRNWFGCERGWIRMLGATAQDGRDACVHLLQGEGLSDIALRARGDGPEQVGVGGVGGDHDDRDLRGEVAVALFKQEAGAIEHRHVDVAEDEVEGCGGLFEDCEAFQAATCWASRDSV